MQVLCKSTNDDADTNCSVCGQGFAVYWERQTKPERAQVMREIEKTLRGHHYNQAGPEAHPTRGFLVPEAERSDCLFRRRDSGQCTQLGALEHLRGEDSGPDRVNRSFR